MKLLKKNIICLLLSIVTIASFLSVEANAKPNKQHINKGHAIKDKVSINDSDVIESDILTYDELVQEVVKNENLTVEEAKEFLGINEKLRSGGHYRTYTKSVYVTAGYRPTLVFYCKTSEWGNYRGILSVIKSSMNRSYYGVSKAFEGELYTNLEDASNIYYELNGDFYDYGYTSFSAGAEITVGGQATANFSVSRESNHYRYCYQSGRYTINR